MVDPEETFHGSVADLVAAQVARTPDAPAVTFGAATLSFAELGHRAGLLARQLAAVGVRPGTLVAVHLARSPDLLVALLAIAQAGGAYVPLGLDLPAGRLDFLLGDCAATVVVTQSHLLGTLPATEAQLVCVDADHADDGAAGASPDGSPRGAGPDDLAYVIYTSGSTGRPKGVEILHRSLTNLLQSMAQRPGLGPTDVLLAITTISFDLAVPDMWLPLVTGARLVVAPTEASRDPGLLMELLEASGATAMQATPATWRMLVEAGWSGKPGFKALCGGEALPGALADQLLDRELDLWNMYGPTETTVWSAALQVTTGGQSVPIGPPIANTTLSILDPSLAPVAVGAAGELHIGGLGLARGYLNRPELTAERFIASPFDPAAGARLYRTGDLARRRPDGMIDFLGRLDHQVKVRGFRIECGEVEAALAAQAEVRTAVVVAREDAPGDARLVAYVVLDHPGDGARADLPAELRTRLATSLPDYMIPSAVVPLDVLPLTPNGKVDRAALPAPADHRRRPGGATAPPRTGIEEVLVAIWAEVLGIDELDVDDDFFDLGGHSLLAVRVLSRVRDALAAEVPLRAIFDEPTVAGLARVVDDLRTSTSAPAPPLLAAARGAGARPPLSLAQHPLWFLDQLVPGNAFYNMPSAYRLSGPLDAGRLEQALTGIVARHEALRTSFPAPGGRPYQRIAAPAPVPVPVEDLSGLGPDGAEAEARRRAGAEAVRPFDLAAGPLVRPRLLRLGPDDHVLLLTVHHIVSDGWSTGVLLDELSALYEGRPLAGLPVQYADFAEWQRSWLEGGLLDAQLDHWQRRLNGAPSVLEVQPDHPRPSVPSYRGAIHTLVVPPALVQALRARGRARGATLHMTMLAAFKVLLARWSGRTDIVVAGTTSGRIRSELEGMIGFFVNPLVLRTDLGGDPAFAEVIDRVRRTALDAYQHQDAPFDKVVERLAPPRDLSRNPLVQIAFELQEHDPVPTSLGELVTLTDVGGPSGAAYGAAAGGVNASLDIELFLAGAADGSLHGSLVHAAELYDPATTSRLADDYQTILTAVAADDTLPISQLPLGADPDHDDLLPG